MVTEEMIAENLYLIKETMRFKVFRMPYAEDDNLYSAGLLGLYKASETYDDSRGKTFTTYARTCIRNEIITEVRRIKKYNSLVVQSLHEDCSTTDDMETIIVQDIIPSITRGSDEILLTKELQELVTNVVETLREKDAIIAMHYFGLRGYTVKKQSEIVNLLGIPKGSVSRIIKKVLSVVQPIVKNYLDNTDLTQVNYLYSLKLS